MKRVLIVFISCLMAEAAFGQCPTNHSCSEAHEFCRADTITVDCGSEGGGCGYNDSKKYWFSFYVQKDASNITISGNGSGLEGYALYGPLQTNYDCNSLPTPLDSLSDTTFSSYTYNDVSKGNYLLWMDPYLCNDLDREMSVEIDNRFGLTCPAQTQLDTVICENCIGSFAPIPGEKYLVTAWTKEDDPAVTKTSYTYPEIYIDIPSTGDTLGPFQPTGKIIDGWQRIESEFTVPAGATDIEIRFSSTSGDVYFDDVRVLPFDGSMKTFVYDPVNMRLVAELDERHYATYYEYNEEGQLVRIKKETERGIMTIQETRNNSSK